MTRSPLLCCTSIIRSSPLVQASSSLSMICARAWPTGATRQRNPFPPFFARVFVTIAAIRGHSWAQDVTEKKILWAFVFGSRTEPIWAPSHLSLCIHTPTAHPTAISRFSFNFFAQWPHICCQHTIHQVIWPSPGTLPLGQSTWWFVMTKKLRGHSGKKIAWKSRNSWCVNGRGCGCIGTVESGPKCAQSWNQIQTLKHYIFCHIYCAHLCTPLHRIVGDVCRVPNRESRYPPSPHPNSFGFSNMDRISEMDRISNMDRNNLDRMYSPFRGRWDLKW